MKQLSTALFALLLCCTMPSSHSTTQDNKTMVKLHTNKGDITLQLDAEKAPKTVRNFLEYVNSGFYNGTIFHRVIGNFMIQGGGFTKNFAEKPTRASIKNEAANGLKNLRGTLAMARTSVVDSATSQFFINVADNAFLDYKGKRPEDYGYAVFGQVVAGMDVVDALKAVKTGNKAGHADVPVETVFITKASLLA